MDRSALFKGMNEEETEFLEVLLGTKVVLKETLYWYDGPISGLFVSESSKFFGMALGENNFIEGTDPWLFCRISDKLYAAIVVAIKSYDLLAQGDALRNIMLWGSKSNYLANDMEGYLVPFKQPLPEEFLPTLSVEVIKRMRK
jgi:hypothetical protein